MTLQKALEIIEQELKTSEPYGTSDFDDALRVFLPLMKAAVALEKEGRDWIVKVFMKELAP